MSSTTASTVSSPTSAPTSSPTSDSGMTGGNYFFGFLITFIALLFMFVACGVRTRRRLRHGRIIDLDALAGMPGFFGSTATVLETPVLWELWVHKADEAKWGAIQPLSTNKLARESSNERPPPLRLSPNLGALNGLSLPRWKAQPHPVTRKVEQSTLQVTVLISMPRQQLNKDSIPDYQIGVVQLPWHEPTS